MRSWLERISSSTALRAWRTCGVFVLTTMPSDTGITQAAASERAPTSTTHMRQAPISLMSLSQQRVGILIPAACAALRTVVPSSTETGTPSIVK